MAFNSPLFVFLFAPLVIGVHFALPPVQRRWLVLIASVAFYAWGEPRFVAVILVSSVIDHAICLAMIRSRNPLWHRILLGVGIASNLSLLLYFKYFSFAVDNLEYLFGLSGVNFANIIVPLGISFIVFEKITYIVDVYRQKSSPARSIFDYLTFVFLFPKLLAGPILKFHEMRDQIERHSLNLDDLEQGLSRFILGLIKKVLIADSVGQIADILFAANADQIGFQTAWLGALAFTVQIYFDFSAYSDMAIGLSRMLGFRLRENFDQPYLAAGFTDFWRRWHISLSTWIRDYLYFPLGGNRRSEPRVFLNLWICFLASGLWHGANWTFVLWGAFHGVFVSADHLGLAGLWKRLPRFLGVAVTFAFVSFSWVLFRASSIDQAFALWSAMLNPMRTSQLDYDPPMDALFFLLLGLVLSFIPLDQAQRMGHALFGGYSTIVQRACLLLVCFWPLGRLLTATFSPFIYFRF